MLTRERMNIAAEVLRALHQVNQDMVDTALDDRNYHMAAGCAVKMSAIKDVLDDIACHMPEPDYTEVPAFLRKQAD